MINYVHLNAIFNNKEEVLIFHFSKSVFVTYYFETAGSCSKK